MERFSQVILYGVALLAIWGGIFSLAFGAGSSEGNYLILALGGLVSSGMAMMMVEMRARNHDGHLDDPQGYLLGLGFFFLAIGVMWGSRFLVGWAQGTGIAEGLAGEGVGAWRMDHDAWYPNATAALFQTATVLVMMQGMMQVLQRYSGSTLFGWSVVVFTPIGLLWAGLGTWMVWSEGLIDWEITVAVLVLCSASMYASIRSDLAFTFGVAAVTTSLLPIVYQMATTMPEEEGFAGVGMLIPLILLQGWFARDERLRRELVERVSWGMVGLVGLVMVASLGDDTPLRLASFTVADVGLDPALVTPGVLLWFTMLVGYFPAVQQRRVPAMPIVLAGTLWSFSGDAALAPWLVAVTMAAYMLGYAEATRTWVATATLGALTGSMLIRSMLVGEGLIEASAFLDERFAGVIPLALLGLALLGRGRELVPRSSPMFVVLLIVLMPTTNALLMESWWLAWVVALLPLALWQSDLRRSDGDESGSHSLQGLVAMSIAAILSVGGLLRLPVGGEEAPVLLVAAIVYGLGRAGRAHQQGLGSMLNNFVGGGANEDSDETETTGGLDDPSLIVTTMLLTHVAAGPEASALLALLSILPHLLLLGEAMALERITSKDRLVGVLVLCMLTVWPFTTGAWPLSLDGSDPLTSLMLHEFGVVLVPAVVLLTRRDRMVYDSSILDQWTLLALLALAASDIQVGLRLLVLYFVTCWQAHRHGQTWILALAPLVWMFNPLASSQGLFLSAVELQLSALLGQDGFWLLNISTVGALAIFASMLPTVGASITARRKGLDDVGGGFATAWMMLSILVLVPDIGWAGFAVLFLLTMRQWWFGRPDHVLLLHLGMLMWGLLFIAANSMEPLMAMQQITLVVGLVATSFTLGTPALLLRYCAPLTEEGMTQAASNAFDAGTMQGRDNTVQTLEFSGIVLLLITPGVFGGLGHLLGAALGTLRLLRRPNDIAVASMPVLHAFAVVVLLTQYGYDAPYRVAGLVVALEAAGLLLIGFREQDPLSDFLDRVGSSESRSRDLAGLLGLGYMAVAVQLILGDVQSPVLRWGSVALMCLGVGITGFQENGASWRRAVGVYGGLVSLFILAVSIDNEFTRSLLFLVIGLVAFGFGTLYIQRRGEFSTVSAAGMLVPSPAPTEDEAKASARPLAPIPPPVLAPTSEQGGLLARVHEAMEESADEGAELGDEGTGGEEAHEAAAEGPASAMEFPPDSTEMPEKGPAAESKAAAVASFGHPSTPSAGGVQMDFEMDDGMKEKLTAAILQTPHDGFRPTLRITGTGEVLLEFRPI